MIFFFFFLKKKTYKDIEKELIARQEHCEKAKINVNEDVNIFNYVLYS